MSYKSCTPLSYPDIGNPVRALLPEEAKTAVRFSIDFASIDLEALSNDGLQLRHSTRCFTIDVRAGTIAAMHYEGSIVHTNLGKLEEVSVKGLPIR